MMHRRNLPVPKLREKAFAPTDTAGARPSAISFLDILGFCMMIGTVLLLVQSVVSELIIMRHSDLLFTLTPVVIALGLIGSIGVFSDSIAGAIRRYLDVRRRVFVSYSEFDRELAQIVGNNLNKKGFKVFLSLDSIKPGEPFKARLEHALNDSDVLVFFVPQQIGDGARKELRFAVEQHLKIVPIVTSASGSMPPAIREIKPIDLKGITGDAATDISKLMESVPAFT